MHPNVKVLIEREYDAQKSEAWLKLRGNMLTASDAATAIGKNKYETPEGLLLKKCGLGEKFTGNAATRHGEKYEDEARIIYEQRHGEVVHEIGLCPHPEHSWLGGSPDGVSESGKLVEIKCPPQRAIIPGEVPEHYMPQLQLCMEILDLESADFRSGYPADRRELLRHHSEDACPWHAYDEDAGVHLGGAVYQRPDHRFFPNSDRHHRAADPGSLSGHPFLHQ